MRLNSPVKKIIFDTDMGVDCDDAVALAILLNKHKKKEIEILCATASSTREGATATIKAIADYYGVSLKIGAMALPSIKCDSINNYSKAVKEKYGTEDVSVDAISLIRSELANSKQKVTVVAVGPLTNMERLLNSKGDESSPLNGMDLVREKVDKIYCMGGSFVQNYSFFEDGDFEKAKVGLAEWNILQDISAAQNFLSNTPVGCIFVPFEIGWSVRTKMQTGDNPVWYSMLNYAISEKFEYQPTFERMSWDPVTCLCAVDCVDEYLDYSKKGKILVDDKGVTTFKEGEGEDQIVLNKQGFKKLADIINSMIEPVVD